MGDIADMVLDGMMCEQCGEYLGKGDGYPRSCKVCSSISSPEAYSELFGNKKRCPLCNKWVKKVGLPQHLKAKHPEELK